MRHRCSRPLRLAVRTSPSHGENTSSILVGVTSLPRAHLTSSTLAGTTRLHAFGLVGFLAFGPVTTDHRLCLIGEAHARGDALAKLALILFDLVGLPVATRRAALLVRNVEGPPACGNAQVGTLIQIIFSKSRSGHRAKLTFPCFFSACYCHAEGGGPRFSRDASRVRRSVL